jgi:hypothetical protein
MMRLQGVCRCLTFGWFAWFGCFGLAQEPNAPLSVCDVITNIKKYRNKVQLVEGRPGHHRATYRAIIGLHEFGHIRGVLPDDTGNRTQSR